MYYGDILQYMLLLYSSFQFQDMTVTLKQVRVNGLLIHQHNTLGAYIVDQLHRTLPDLHMTTQLVPVRKS